MLAMICPAYDVGIVTYSIPLAPGVTAYAKNRSHNCVDSLGVPPLWGVYGGCTGSVTSADIPYPDGGEDSPMDDAYQALGTTMFVTGPSYGGFMDRRAGARLAPGERATPVVILPGIFGWRAAEHPSGEGLVLGLLSPLLLLAGLALLIRPSSAAPGDGAATARPKEKEGVPS